MDVFTAPEYDPIVGITIWLDGGPEYPLVYNPFVGIIIWLDSRSGSVV